MIRAFSSEVDAGSREESASKLESRTPFRFDRNGKGSSFAPSRAADSLKAPPPSPISAAA
ncbi:hypothetical protein BSN85_08260 [Bradyrhizobium brasilense]|nr:hypothetical protein BSN85_08260 [Bradyrhizobium brasilense]